MKKIIISLSIVLTLGLSFQTADAFKSQYADFWAELFGRYKRTKSIKPVSVNANYPIMTDRNRRALTLRSRFNSSNRFANRTAKTPVYSNQYFSNEASLLATINSSSNNKSIYQVTESPISVFKVGIKNIGKTASSKLPKTAMLDSAEFQLFASNGIFQNPRDFLLMVEDEEFRFSDDGKVTIKFNNARLAESESLSLDISIRADDPNQMYHTSGSTKLRLLSLTSYEEFSRDSIPVKISGNRTSKTISYNPVSVVTGGGNSTIVSTSGSSIYGDLVGSGEEVYALATQFNASYDDLSIRSITVRNSLTGNLIDSQIEEIKAVNLSTGELLKTSRFINGEARFLLSPKIRVSRNSKVRIGFKVKVKQNPRNFGDRRFKLDLFPNDVVVESLSNGRELSNANKNFNINSEVFMVVNSSLKFNELSQPSNIVIGTNNPQRAYEFGISNNSRDFASLGRLSFDVFPNGNGLQFNGGSISASDFELVEIRGNSENSLNTTISVSGNKVTFDLNNEFYIDNNYERKFRLKIALDNLGSTSSNDGVSVRLLGDSSYAKNSLSGVRSSGANFIWSDQSGTPHTTGSDDWFSGYRVGIPSNSVYIKR